MKPVRKRARQACIACNARRVKCNVINELPCRNCSQSGSRCQVRESRRGKHPRPSKASSGKNEPTSSRQWPDGLADAQLRLEAQPDDVAATEILASLSRDRLGDQDDNEPTQANEPRNFSPPDESRRGSDETNQHAAVQDTPGDEGSVFLGESTTLRYVHQNSTPTQETESPESTRLLHQVPNVFKIPSQVPDWEAERRQVKIRSLQAEGALSFPEAKVVTALLGTYFRWFHPCFPILNEPDLWHEYQDGKLSPLILNSILFISVIHSDDETLRALGLEGQARAKFFFYNRAKDIYDADYERCKVTIIQSLFLMSFWRNGPLIEKDTRHWLAAAISVAQTKAIHRSTGSTEHGNGAIQKRLWWSIYTRERQCAAALGLPNRIRDKDCDVAPLQPKDFDHAFGDSTPAPVADEYIAYQIGIAGLSRILGRIIHSGYVPGRSLTQSQKSDLRQDLTSWKRKLPSVMQIEGESHIDEPPSIHAGMLHLAYNNLLILLYRSDYISATNGGNDGRIALQAASRNSRLVEDLLPGGTLRHAQVHVITNLFNTLCIHTIHLRSAKGTAVPIAEHRAKVCLLGLQELQRTWEVRNWILQLFFKYLDQSTAARLQGQNGAVVRSAQQSQHASRRGSFSLGETSQPMLTPGPVGGPGQPAAGSMSDAPWPWTTGEQNQFLFSQIENNFAFGEGDVSDWGQHVPAAMMFPFVEGQGGETGLGENMLGGTLNNLWEVP